MALLTGLLLCANGLRPESCAADGPPQIPIINEIANLRDDQQYIGQERVWRFNALEMHQDQDSEIIEATGDAMAKSGDDYMLADFARYYKSTGWLYLRGHVRIRWGAYSFEAEEAEFDLNSKVGWMKNGRMLTENPSFFISGKTIRKLDERTYAFEDATMTGCESPAGATVPWSLRAENALVTQDDVAQLYQPRFSIEGLPVLYFPYLSFSTRTKRTSGLLFPEFGNSSVRGAFFRQPFYMVLDDENDMTLTEEIMSSRGLRNTLEFRSMPEAGTKLHLRMDYLHDSKTAPTEGDALSQFSGDGLLRPDADRYWLRGKFDGRLPDTDWKVKVDADFVSDQDYLREFPGYTDDRDTLLNLFGRDIATRDSLTHSSTVLISRDYADYDVNFRSGFTENLSYRNGNLPASSNPTTQYLPELSAYLHRQNLGPTPLEFEAGSDLAYLWRRSGSTASRLELDPQVTMPMQAGIFSIIPSAGLRQTSYAIEGRSADTDPSGSSFETRTVPQASTAAFTEFYRVYDLGNAPLDATVDNAGNSVWTKMRHVMQPRLEYNWVDKPDNTHIPDFDDIDRPTGTNELTYSLTNILGRKRSSVALSGRPGNSYEPVANTDTLDFLRLRLEESYDVNEANRETDLDRFSRQPFTDMLADISLSPGIATLTNRTYVSPYSGEVTEHEHALTVATQTLGSYTMTFDFLNDARRAYFRQLQTPLKTAGIQAQVPLGQDFRLDVRHSRDLRNGDNINAMVSLTYFHYCFDTVLLYRDDAHDRSISLQFVLLGLASPSFGYGLGSSD